MRNLRLLVGVGMCFVLSGCVIGSGPCLWLQARHYFAGRVHFREFPRNGGIDTVAILVLDKTEYIYAPPQSFQCLPANELQLINVVELPDGVGENSHVIVDGKVLEGVTDGQHTHFVINAISVLPFRSKT